MKKLLLSLCILLPVLVLAQNPNPAPYASPLGRSLIRQTTAAGMQTVIGAVNSNSLYVALSSSVTNAAVGAVNTASNNILVQAKLAGTNAAAGVVTNESNFAVTNATRTPLVRWHPQRLPINTLTKLAHGQGVNVLWLGDSLVAVNNYTLAKGYFGTNILATYGTNGYWGGYEYSGILPWSPIYSVTGNFPTPDVSYDAPWLSVSFILTNGTSALWQYRTGDGFTTADHAGLVLIQTNAPSPGTLTVQCVSDALITNTLDVVTCSGARNAWATNYSLPSLGRYKLLLTASGGNGFFAEPGLWNSTGTGIRYGYVAYGGVNNFTFQTYFAACLKAFQPDLLLCMDANDNSGGPTLLSLITQMQSGVNALTNMDVVFVGVQPNSFDLNAQDGENTASDYSWGQALFAKTNANTTFEDLKFLLGNGTSYQTLTNLGLTDVIHPLDPAYSIIAGKRLMSDLGLNVTTVSVPTGFASLTADNSISGNQWFSGNVTVGGGSSQTLSVTNGGFSIAGSNSVQGLSMHSRTAADAIYYRFYVETNAWHLAQSANESKDVLSVKYNGNVIQLTSDGPYFNYDNTFVHQPSIGRADRPYVLFGSSLVGSNDWTRPPTLAEGDCYYTSSNGTPTVIRKLGGVLRTNNLVTPP